MVSITDQFLVRTEIHSVVSISTLMAAAATTRATTNGTHASVPTTCLHLVLCDSASCSAVADEWQVQWAVLPWSLCLV
jgi:hypothetical protein